MKSLQIVITALGLTLVSVLVGLPCLVLLRVGLSYLRSGQWVEAAAFLGMTVVIATGLGLFVVLVGRRLLRAG